MPFANDIHYTLHQPKEIDSSRPPLILIHGAGGSFLSFHPYLRRLTSERVYALDLPGHGESKGEGKNSIEEYAEDVYNFMHDMHIESAVVTGLSMGSGIALTLALRYPQSVKALILFGAGAKLRVAPFILEAIGKPETFSSTVHEVNRACFGPHAPQDLVALSEKSMLNAGPQILLGDYLACDHFDVTSKLGEIHIPALILCGADDAMTPPKYSHYLKDHLSNAQLHIIEKAGHMVTLEQPEVLVKLMKKFLDELPPRS